MNHLAILLLRAIAPALAVMVAVLGFATLGTHLLGWFLFLASLVYGAAVVVLAFSWHRNFWEPQSTGLVTHAEAGDRSFWLLTAAIAAIFFLPPLELLYLSEGKLSNPWLEWMGASLAALGALLFGWARRFLHSSYSAHLYDRARRPLLPSGPYRILRHPTYAGYLLTALGLVLGYSSVAGMAALGFLLLPAVLWRIHVEERLLSAAFGDEYRDYTARTRRLIPGLW